MWRVIFFTIIAILATATVLVVTYRAGRLRGEISTRKQLDAPARRHIKRLEELVDEGNTLLRDVVWPGDRVDLEDMSTLSPHHQELAVAWLKKKNGRL